MATHQFSLHIQRRRAPSFIALTLVMVVSVVMAETLGPANFDIDWNTIDGGGGTSVGGDFEMSGTIGQPDAGVMSGGTFEFEGGFWSGAQPQPQAPVCIADIAPPGGDSVVGVPDLLMVISNWGACPNDPAPCPADIAPPGGDNAVGVPDLLKIISSWGPCPQ